MLIVYLRTFENKILLQKSGILSYPFVFLKKMLKFYQYLKTVTSKQIIFIVLKILQETYLNFNSILP